MITNNFEVFVKEEQQKQIKYRKLIICLYGTKIFKLLLKNSFSRFKWLQAIFMSMAVKMVIHKYCNLSHAQVRKRYLHLHKKQCRLSPTNIDIMP
jgi:tmRNA-binding protein